MEKQIETISTNIILLKYRLIDKLNESEKSEEFQRSRIVSLAVPKTKKFIHMLEEKHNRITSMLDPTLETMKSAPKKFVHHEVGYPRYYDF
jgi:hypothetical protein